MLRRPPRHTWVAACAGRLSAWLQAKAAAHHVVCVEDVVALIAQYAADEEARREARARVGARVPVVALLRRGGGRVSATRYTVRAPQGLRDAGPLATLLRRGPLLLYDDCYNYNYALLVDKRCALVAPLVQPTPPALDLQLQLAVAGMGAVHDAEQPLRQRLRGTVLAVEPHRSHTVCPGEANVRQVRPRVGRYLECEVRESGVRLLLVIGLLAARATVRLRLRGGSGRRPAGGTLGCHRYISPIPPLHFPYIWKGTLGCHLVPAHAAQQRHHIEADLLERHRQKRVLLPAVPSAEVIHQLLLHVAPRH